MADKAVITLYEARDAGRVLNLTPGGVVALVKRGHLTPVAATPRGLRLYRVEDIAALQRKRAQRARASTRAMPRPAASAPAVTPRPWPNGTA
jgi:hypothetical protein